MKSNYNKDEGVSINEEFFLEIGLRVVVEVSCFRERLKVSATLLV